MARAYGAERTPEVFVFDRRRVLRYYGRIDDNVHEPDQIHRRCLQEAIDALLEGRDVPLGTREPAGCTIKWKS